MNPDINQKSNDKTNIYKYLFLTVFLAFVILSIFAIYQKTNYIKNLNSLNKEFADEVQRLRNLNQCSECNRMPDTPISTLPEGEFKTYSSDKLGISFSYYQNTKVTPPIDLKIKEINNKIYLNTNSSNDVDTTKGKSIEIFKKEINQNLEYAVKEKITGNIDACEVTTYETKATIINPSYIYMMIKYPIVANSSYQELKKAAEKCNIEYTMFNGVNYFVMDKGHPDRFAAIHLGQDNFAFPIIQSVDNDIRWDYTISFY